MGKTIPDSTYKMIDLELTIISDERDLRVSVDGSMEISAQCLVVVTNQIRSDQKRNIKQNREHQHLLDKYTRAPTT